MQLDVNQIKQSNQKAKQLNDERNRLLGEKASAEKNYNRGLVAYEQKYGVKLASDEDLQNEYNRIKSSLYELAQEQQAQIEAIRSGTGQMQQHAPLIDLNSPIQVSAGQASAPVSPSPALSLGSTPTTTSASVTPSSGAVAAGNGTVPVVPTLSFGQTGGSANDDVSEDTLTPNGWGVNNANL